MKCSLSMICCMFVAALNPLRAEDGERKPKGPATGEFHGVDTAANTITLSVREGEGKTFSEIKTALAAECKVWIDGKEGKVAELRPGYRVTLELAGNPPQVTSITAAGSTVVGTVKASTGTDITLLGKPRENGPTVDDVYALAPDVKVSVDGRTVALDALLGSNRVTLTISADGKTVRAITMAGETFAGMLLSATPAALVIHHGKKNNQRDEELTLAPDAKITIGGKDATVASLRANQAISVTLSAVGRTVVAASQGAGKEGRTGVDATNPAAENPKRLGDGDRPK